MRRQRSESDTPAAPPRDPVATWITAGFLAVATPYVGLLFGRAPSDAYRNLGTFVACALLVVVACLAGWRRLERAEERQFRGLVAAAFAVWAASELLDYRLRGADAGTRLTLNDSAFVIFTVLLGAAALGARESGRSRAEDELRRLHRAEVAVFACGVFVYLVVLPTRLAPGSASGTAASAMLYVTLDLMLLGLYLRRRRRLPAGAERVRWGWFVLAAALFLLSDTLFLAATLGQVELDRWTALDLLWYLPHGAVVAGVRRLPAPAATPPAEAARATGGAAIAPGFLYAALVPVVHLVAETLGVPTQSASFGPHRFALAVTVGLLALAVIHQRRQLAVWRGLQREVASGARRRDAAARLEAVGRLAAGVAHDFNNLLTVVVGRADLVRARSHDTDARRELDAILEISHRATGLTSELLAVGERESSRRQTLELDAALSARRAELVASCGESIALTWELGAGEGRIEVDRGHLDRVVDSLVVHAVEAMPGGGRLTIATRRRRLEAGWTSHADEVPAGDYLVVEVRDEGAGMSPAELSRLFEPFSDRPGGGRGAGLGLATVRGLVRQNRGQVVVRSEPGRGTSFELLFPEVA